MTFAMDVLSMGFSWAPWLSLCVAWGIMLSHPLPEGYTMSGINEVGPPRFVELSFEGENIGFMLIFYDNFVCAANAEKHTTSILKWFKDASEKRNCIIKEESIAINQGKTPILGMIVSTASTSAGTIVSSESKTQSR